jgi:NTP pyrophosphatase (non-canonical NTP hydrolase)
MRGSGDFSIGSKVWPGISKLIEECGEVSQVAGKLLGSAGAAAHWDGTDLKTRLESELGDLRAAIAFVTDHCGLDALSIERRRNEKRELFEKWHGSEPIPEEPTTTARCHALIPLHRKDACGTTISWTEEECGNPVQSGDRCEQCRQEGR